MSDSKEMDIAAEKIAFLKALIDEVKDTKDDEISLVGMRNIAYRSIDEVDKYKNKVDVLKPYSKSGASKGSDKNGADTITPPAMEEEENKEKISRDSTSQNDDILRKNSSEDILKPYSKADNATYYPKGTPGILSSGDQTPEGTIIQDSDYKIDKSSENDKVESKDRLDTISPPAMDEDASSMKGMPGVLDQDKFAKSVPDLDISRGIESEYGLGDLDIRSVGGGAPESPGESEVYDTNTKVSPSQEGGNIGKLLSEYFPEKSGSFDAEKMVCLYLTDTSQIVNIQSFTVELRKICSEEINQINQILTGIPRKRFSDVDKNCGKIIKNIEALDKYCRDLKITGKKTDSKFLTEIQNKAKKLDIIVQVSSSPMGGYYTTGGWLAAKACMEVENRVDARFSSGDYQKLKGVDKDIFSEAKNKWKNSRYLDQVDFDKFVEEKFIILESQIIGRRGITIGPVKLIDYGENYESQGRAYQTYYETKSLEKALKMAKNKKEKDKVTNKNIDKLIDFVNKLGKEMKKTNKANEVSAAAVDEKIRELKLNIEIKTQTTKINQDTKKYEYDEKYSRASSPASSTSDSSAGTPTASNAEQANSMKDDGLDNDLEGRKE